MATAEAARVTAPNLSYDPDFEDYSRRKERRLHQEKLPTHLPPGFPQQFDTPSAWKGSDWKDESVFVYQFSKGDLEDIDQALAHFKSLNLPLGHICQKTFPLKSLSKQLRQCSNDLHNGRGFFVLRGFPVDKYQRLDNVIAYTGVSSYIGSLRGWQDPSASVVIHVTDLSKTHTVGTPAYTADKQVFHTDNGDIVSLLALQTAAEGGTSKIASISHVYNVFAKARPDLIKTLTEEWPCDNFGRDPAHYMRPLLYLNSQQRLMVQYFRRLFTGFNNAPRPSSIPPITDAQAEALDALEFYARDECLDLDFQKGDIQYINNLSIFHARDGYKDSEQQRRHLLRLWLRDEEYGWQIPEKLQSGPGRTWDSLHYEEVSNEQRFVLDPEVKIE
ncbi:MAG: hypothetical protein M1828_006681 [Chrysothrix sp. TS-e1954]|nr:MAG: hypothetical protein M1828_006681 [Chrysothrix sp. TS-e1954]